MIKKITLAMVVALAGTSLHAEPVKKDNIHMFPQAKEGFVRHVIEVPKTTTMMACSKPKTKKFISIRDTLRRYS